MICYRALLTMLAKMPQKIFKYYLEDINKSELSDTECLGLYILVLQVAKNHLFKSELTRRLEIVGIKNTMVDGESDKGKRNYTKMLKWLDNPNREKINNSEKLIKSSGIQPGQTVLEIGCGSGFFTVQAAKILGENGTLYSTDIHAVAIEETQKKVDRVGLKNVVVKIDDAMNSTLEDSMFDLVLLYGVVPAPIISIEKISGEIHRMLKPGGTYAIWTQIPFWTPRAAIKSGGFAKMKKVHSVFLLKKIND